MAMEVAQIEHLSHVHPLMLIKPEETDGGSDLSCYGCGQPIPDLSSSSSYYGCKRCAFFLHKSCAELPGKMTHPSHPQHPLTLLLNPPGEYKGVPVCDICDRVCHRFTYHCSLCKYDIDMKCALEVLCIQYSIHHPSHNHQLIPFQKESKFLCQACGREHKGTSYLCSTCGFWINQNCAASPLTVEVNNHPHTLTLVYSVPQEAYDQSVGPIECEICSFAIYRRNWVYYCSECNYLAHLLCAVPKKEREVVQHLRHDHPLMLIKPEETDESWDLSCYACKQPIRIWSLSSSYYGCKKCVFFLHKACAELPPKITHPSHHQHMLTLNLEAPSEGRWCEVCTEYCTGYYYYCSRCNYLIDLKCALEVLRIRLSIDHPRHDHQLIPFQKESMFLCDGCGTKHTGTSYLCTSCGFWINQTCAESPLAVKVNNHPHTLTLIYSVPQEEHHHHFGELNRKYVLVAHKKYINPLKCEICSFAIYRRNWVYYCSKCHYLAHLHCAVNNKTENETHDLGHNTISPSSDTSATANSDADQYKHFHLPMPDDSADIITQFIKATAIQGNHMEEAEIKHSSHDYPLTLFKKPIDHASSLLNGATNGGKCRGCAQDISAPFYGCVECKFFLHLWCAELPKTLLHPGHPEHSLSLCKKVVGTDCICCNLYGTLFFYKCESCGFYLDCKCASLPRVIKHDSHKRHTLALRSTSVSSTCISCGASLRISYECGTCKFNLCGRCALIPGTVRHRYDKHPFTLTYSPPSYQTDDDFCEICEEVIDSKRWFYHCQECTRYLHTACVLPADQFSNIVYEHWGDTFTSRKHPHQLIWAKRKKETSCSLCERSNADSEYCCPPCQFDLCYPCAEKENGGEI